MYTYEENDGAFEILDPDGDFIATVPTKDQAENLLSHLNR